MSKALRLFCPTILLGIGRLEVSPGDADDQSESPHPRRGGPKEGLHQYSVTNDPRTLCIVYRRRPPVVGRLKVAGGRSNPVGSVALLRYSINHGDSVHT